MDKPMPNLAFEGMSWFFKLRYFLSPRAEVLKEVNIKPSSKVLDYGCGPGGYVRDTAALVGPTGIVYALDIHPLAVKKVEAMAKRERLTNVKTIRSDCQTGLSDSSVDVVLLYDVFHMLSEPQAVLAELHRILKPDGVLSFTADHMDRDEAVARLTKGRLFRLAGTGKRTFSFSKQA